MLGSGSLLHAFAHIILEITKSDISSTKQAMESESPESLRICIIGAGISGLSACKHLLQHGIEPVVLEASQGIGGVWRRTCASTRLQNHHHTYQFSDFPWPPDTPQYPSHDQVVDYLVSYANNFDLTRWIQFNSEVVRLVRLPNDPILPEQAHVKWEVHINRKLHNGARKLEKLAFDFIVMCVGRFGDAPRIPSFPDYASGPDIFKGKVLHAMHYSVLDNNTAIHLLKGKQTVLIGFQKSAIDIAVEVVHANVGQQLQHPCTLIYRRVPWLIPDFAPWGVSFGRLYFTRFAELCVRKPGQGLLFDILSTFLTPTKWAISKLVELYLLLKLPLRQYNLIPETSFCENFSSCSTVILPENFFAEVEKGHIRFRKSVNWNFSKRGVVLEDGSEIEADVVIFATGYDSERKLISLLPDEYRSTLLDCSTNLVPLYRGIIHPHIPDMAIIGYEGTLSNLSSSEMSARWLAYLLSGKFWLAYLLSGKFCLPDQKTMEEDSKKWVNYIASSLLPKRACVGVVSIWRADQLCKDMGWNPRRKKSWIQELFSPYNNLDYKDPIEEKMPQNQPLF